MMPAAFGDVRCDGVLKRLNVFAAAVFAYESECLISRCTGVHIADQMAPTAVAAAAHLGPSTAALCADRHNAVLAIT